MREHGDSANGRSFRSIDVSRIVELNGKHRDREQALIVRVNCRFGGGEECVWCYICSR